MKNRKKTTSIIYHPESSTYRLDWLRYTVPMAVGIRHALPDGWGNDTIIPMVTGRLGYTNQITTSEGFVVMWNAQRPEMGIMCDLAGSTINSPDYGSYNLSPDMLFHHVLENAGQFTRIDFAVDMIGTEHTIDDLELMVKEGFMHFAGREITTVGGHRKNKVGEFENSGKTLYLGSRTSDRFLRYYDKAAQQQIMGLSWNRIEMEIKGKRANGLTQALAGSVAGEYNRILANEVLGYLKPVKKPAQRLWNDIKAILETQKEFKLGRGVPNPSQFFDRVVMPFINANRNTLSEDRLNNLRWIVEQELMMRNTD